MTELDEAFGAIETGGAAAGLRFYRALADAELLLLLEHEAEGEVISPRVMTLSTGPVVLAFDSEERMAMLHEGPVAYAALPGRIIAQQLAGQGVGMMLNPGSGAASETMLPPAAMDWLVEMLDQVMPVPGAAVVAGFAAAMVPEAVVVALSRCLAGATGLAGCGYLVGVICHDGRRGQMLAITGVRPEDEAPMARAVAEALAFSGIKAGALDVSFVHTDDPRLALMSGLAMVFPVPLAATPEALTREAPGIDPGRPPRLRQVIGVI